MIDSKLTLTRDLKAGMIVLFYNAKFEVLEDATNHGQQKHNAENTIMNDNKDVWSAPCKCIEPSNTSLDSVLRGYNTFQSNSIKETGEHLVVS
jgi:hypothetical protein